MSLYNKKVKITCLCIKKQISMFFHVIVCDVLLHPVKCSQNMQQVLCSVACNAKKMAERVRDRVTRGNGSELVTRPMADVSGFVSVKRSVGCTDGEMGNPWGSCPLEEGAPPKRANSATRAIEMVNSYNYAICALASDYILIYVFVACHELTECVL